MTDHPRKLINPTRAAEGLAKLDMVITHLEDDQPDHALGAAGLAWRYLKEAFGESDSAWRAAPDAREWSSCRNGSPWRGKTGREATARKLNPGRIPEGRGGPGAYLMTVMRPGEGVKTTADGDLLSGLEAAFSPERIGTYLRAVQGDRDQALRLYTWNTAVCAAFYGPLQALEVALRNAMHRELTARYGEKWYDNPAAGLDRGARERIADARMTALRASHDATPARVVATLAFGFWVTLLGRGARIERDGPKADYEKTLWRPALRGAFSHHSAPLTRRQAHEPLDALRALRNRIAHHEPVFARPLREDHDRVREVTGWISPAVRAWIEQHSRVPRLLDAAAGATDDDF